MSFARWNPAIAHRAFLLTVYTEDEYLAPFFLKKNGFREIIRWAGSGGML
jgi:hypothetical protein